jgi:hypothetical protein
MIAQLAAQHLDALEQNMASTTVMLFDVLRPARLQASPSSTNKDNPRLSTYSVTIPNLSLDWLEVQT